MRKLRTATVATALIVALGLLVVGGLPVAKASTVGSGYVYLYDVHAAYGLGGIAASNASTDWRVYVEAPQYVALDDTDEYWNFTVYLDCVDVAGATEGITFDVYIYIYDGTTNLTANAQNLAGDAHARVYGNISIAAASYAGMVQNDSADLYIKFTNGTTPATLKDYYSGHIRVDSYGFVGLIWMMIPLVIMMAVMGNFMGAMSGTMGKSRKSGKSGKKKR